LAGAVIPAGLYVLYVLHYSVNAPYSDDWNMIPLVVSAVHGKLGLSDLLSQYGDTRLFVPKLFFALFAVGDHWNTKSILLFSALVFVASYLLLLLLLRSYLARALSFFPVFAVGVVWFSLADLQNALWSFQLAWYFATFFFVVMIYFLLSRRRHWVLFALGILAAIAGSYSIVQGFVLWPVGLICVLWDSPWARRTYLEATAWISAAVITVVVYWHGFDTANSQCGGAQTCTASYGLRHPQLLARYVVLLVGNVIPTTFYAVRPNLVLHELIGAAVVLIAAFVVVQSIRERRTSPSPLPLLLIAFGLLFDGLIAIGRFGGGPSGALNNNRYTMPNLVLLTGIVIYFCAHYPFVEKSSEPAARHGWIRVVGLATLCGLLLLQGVVATGFGITNGRTTHQAHETAARVVVNFDQIPSAQQGCDAALAVLPPQNPSQALYNLETLGNAMARDHLSVFEFATARSYRAKGPPTGSAILAAGNFAAVTSVWAGLCS
jgi:hypothetical protein